jgi:hypothetical protein
MQNRRTNTTPRIAPGPFLSKLSLERILIFAPAWRSSHGTGPGTSVVLVRWIRRAAFLGTAARARPCGHAFFVFRFLARGSAGTDVSFTRRARRGLVLSRRNKRRAEERSYDKSRDCKFGSHQKTPKLVRMNPNLGHAILFRPMANIAQISYSKKAFVIAARASITFPNIRHLQNIGFAQSASNGVCLLGNTPCSWTLSRVLVAQNAGRRWHCGLSNLKDRGLICTLSTARNVARLKP